MTSQKERQRSFQTESVFPQDDTCMLPSWLCAPPSPCDSFMLLRNNGCVSGHSNFLKASFQTLVCSWDTKLLKSTLFLYVCSHRSPRQLLWVSGQHLWNFFPPVALNINKLTPSLALILYCHIFISFKISNLTEKNKQPITSPRCLDVMRIMGSPHCFNSILSKNVTEGAECDCSGWKKLQAAGLSFQHWERSNLQPC